MFVSAVAATCVNAASSNCSHPIIDHIPQVIINRKSVPLPFKNPSSQAAALRVPQIDDMAE
jgi:hypothetical protein